MIKKAFLLLFTFQCFYSFSVEKEFSAGISKWTYHEIRNLEIIRNDAREYSLVLRDGEYAADEQTRLLLDFNTQIIRDSSGNFNVNSSKASVSTGRKRYGSGAGLFNSEKDSIILSNDMNKIFPDKVYSGDFTIEFWLYGVNFSDGETILLFDSYAESGNQFYPQFFKTFFSDRKLVWHIKNFFLPYDRDQFEVVLKGTKRLIPGTWSHHLLRYRSDLGLMEYLIDGIPDAVLHINRKYSETGEYYPFYTGEKGKIIIGDRFTGLLDQFRIKSEWVDTPELSGYRDYSGYYISEPIDLGHSKSSLYRIDARDNIPPGTDIRYYYNLKDTKNVPETDSPLWKRFTPGDIQASEGGRFLRILAVLYSDGNRNGTPSISGITVKYDEKNPPQPPRLVRAEPGDSSVRVLWNKVSDEDIDGYMVYFGEKPGQYFGRSGYENSSPIDAGLNTEITVDNLENGRIYYFSVVPYHRSASAYGNALIKMGGQYSREVSARPLSEYGADDSGE